MSICNKYLIIAVLIAILQEYHSTAISTYPNIANNAEKLTILNFLSDDNPSRPFIEVSVPSNLAGKSVVDISAKKSVILKCISKTPITWITPIPKDFFYPIIPYDKAARTTIVNGSKIYVNNLQLLKLRYTHTGFYQCCDIKSKIPKYAEESDLETCSKKIYIFANDMEHLIVPAREQMPQNMVYITLVKDKPLYFPCKSTYSDANVELISKRKVNMARHPFDPKRGFWISAPNMKYHSAYDCVVTRENVTQSRMYMAIYKGMTLDPKPKIEKRGYKGKIPMHSNFSMECSVEINADDLVDVSWWIEDKKINNQYFNDSSIRISVSSETDMPAPNQMKKKTVFSNLNITNIDQKHQNTYKCMVKDHIGKVGVASMDVTVYDPLKESNQSGLIENKFVPQVLNLTSSGENILVPLLPLSPVCASRNFICQAWGYPHPVISWFLEDFCQFSNNSSTQVLQNFNNGLLYLNEYCNISAGNSIKNGKNKSRTLVLKDHSGIDSYPHSFSWNITNQEIDLAEERHIIKSSVEIDSVIKGKLTCRAENSEGFDEQTIEIAPEKRKLNEGPVETLALGLIMSLLLALGSFFLFVVLLITLNYANNKKKAHLSGRCVNIRIPNLEKMCELTLFDGDVKCKKSKISLDGNNNFKFDSELEFPRNRLIIGRCLGEGAFGRVMEAQAIGLGQNDKSILRVAVKIPKNNMDPAQLLSLISEFKIMITIGKHLNLVNLLGVSSVCAEQIQSFMVIMEYCAHGNLRQHLIEGRSKFDLTSVPKEPNNQNTNINDTDGDNVINVSVPTDTLQKKSTQLVINSHTISLTNNAIVDSNRLPVSVEEDKYSETDFSANSCGCRTLEILNYETLMCYAYQIAKGMEYLASKNCIHRDLACRNILLDHNNIAKICDFGLSKDVYQHLQYVKKTDSPVPIKWMAIESLKDNVYTIKSDVWSFGVVLWELFSLGSTPYPGIELGTEFVKKLDEGLRLDQPLYSGKDTYALMVECWCSTPDKRPDFFTISQSISALLEKQSSDKQQDYSYSNYGYYKSLTQQNYSIPSLCNDHYQSLETNRQESKINLSKFLSIKRHLNRMTSFRFKISRKKSKKVIRTDTNNDSVLSVSKLSLTKNISLESTVSSDSAFSNTDSFNKKYIKPATKVSKSYLSFKNFYKSISKSRETSSGDSALGSDKTDQT